MTYIGTVEQEQDWWKIREMFSVIKKGNTRGGATSPLIFNERDNLPIVVLLDNSNQHLITRNILIAIKFQVRTYCRMFYQSLDSVFTKPLSNGFQNTNEDITNILCSIIWVIRGKTTIKKLTPGIKFFLPLN